MGTRTVAALFCLALLSPAGLPAAPDVGALLAGIEERYNHTQSLEVNFTETYTFRNRTRQPEKGTLFLRKPGRMRWQYDSPPGKLFVSDGQFVYYYSPDERRAEKTKFKETDDFRAPLAFLLGKLNFKDDFREFQSTPQGSDTLIVAIPKSDKLPYTDVTFLAGSDFTIKRLSVKGQDGSVTEYSFNGEKRNAPVSDAMFRFTPPTGVDYVDSSK